MEKDKWVYPDDLMNKEKEFIEKRTGIKPENVDIEDCTGFALSGGGIRSATFSLGFFQSLAKASQIRNIDYLSTVSGGGYFGGFLGRLFHSKENADHVESELKDQNSPALKHLREHGRYLAPDSPGSIMLMVASVIRNWIAIHLTIAAVVIGSFLTLQGLYHFIFSDKMNAFVPEWIQSFLVHESFWVSPLFLVVSIPVAFCLLFGISYWIFPHHGKTRNRLTVYLSYTLKITILFFFVALIDSFGHMAYIINKLQGFKALLSTVPIVVLATLGRQLLIYLSQKGNGKKFKAGLNVITTLIAFTVALVMLTIYASLSHRTIYQDKIPNHAYSQRINKDINTRRQIKTEASPGTSIEFQTLTIQFPEENQREILDGDPALHQHYLTILGICLFFSIVIGYIWPYINLTSHHPFYAARLRRAYLGAGNTGRKTVDDIDKYIDDDDLKETEYHPHQYGGPLHFINVTINETVEGRTQKHQRDRRGNHMTIGPHGYSVGIKHHFIREGTPTPDEGYRVFPENKDTFEKLTLAQWVSISGAAVSTGAGAKINASLSFLIGIANIRLGYWWDSGIKPSTREGKSRLQPFMFKVQIFFFRELFALFPGTAFRRWYVTDGGHYENLGLFELLRRRLRFMVALSNGAHTDDISVLVLKARIDLGADINFLSREEIDRIRDTNQDKDLSWLGTIHDLQHVSVDAEDTDTFKPKSEKDKPIKLAKAHATLAHVTYADEGNDIKPRLLLYIKPTMIGDEPMDIVHYQEKNPKFPYEPITDQFFEEAQWESYRWLGERIGQKLFGEHSFHELQNILSK